MAPHDHNKTIMVLFSLIAFFPSLLLCAAPWIIDKNVSSIPSPRRDEQILTAAIITVAIGLLVFLLWATVAGLYMRKLWGRRLALFSSIFILFYCPPVSVYTWWFMHSEGGKRLYGIPTTSADN